MVGKNTKKKAMFLDEVDLSSKAGKFDLRDKLPASGNALLKSSRNDVYGIIDPCTIRNPFILVT